MISKKWAMYCFRTPLPLSFTGISSHATSWSKTANPGLLISREDEKVSVYYDVASFLWQAKANYPEDLRNELLADYLQALRKYTDVDEEHFFCQLRHFVLFRTLQVLEPTVSGILWKETAFYPKRTFAINNLRQLLKNDYPEYPYLCAVLRELTGLTQFRDDIQKRMLEVKIVSFAYKKEYRTIRAETAVVSYSIASAINNPENMNDTNHFTGLTSQWSTSWKKTGNHAILGTCIYDRGCFGETLSDRGFTNLMISSVVPADNIVPSIRHNIWQSICMPNSE